MREIEGKYYKKNMTEFHSFEVFFLELYKDILAPHK